MFVVAPLPNRYSLEPHSLFYAAASAVAGGVAAFPFDLLSRRFESHLLAAACLVLVLEAGGSRGVHLESHGLAAYRYLDGDPHFYHQRYLLITIVKRAFC